MSNENIHSEKRTGTHVETSNKIEDKEQINPERLKVLLKDWLNALENENDLELEVNGSKKRIPFIAFSQGRLKLEVEWKRGENEFEIELKWPGRPEDTLLKQ